METRTDMQVTAACHLNQGLISSFSKLGDSASASHQLTFHVPSRNHTSVYLQASRDSLRTYQVEYEQIPRQWQFMIVSLVDGLEAYISSHHQLCRSCRGKRKLEQSEPCQPRVLTGERYAVSDYPYFPAFPSSTADPHSLTNGSCQKYGYNE